jgi:hypothetical protein
METALAIGADATGGNAQGTTGTGVSAKKLESETEDFHGVPLSLSIPLPDEGRAIVRGNSLSDACYHIVMCLMAENT